MLPLTDAPTFSATSATADGRTRRLCLPRRRQPPFPPSLLQSNAAPDAASVQACAVRAPCRHREPFRQSAPPPPTPTTDPAVAASTTTAYRHHR